MNVNVCFSPSWTILFVAVIENFESLPETYLFAGTFKSMASAICLLSVLVALS